MIRQRIFGSDADFMDWLRCQEKELPSSSVEFGFVATDSDAHIHVYKTEIDSMGTRDIQALMFLEAKTRGGNVTVSQQDTLAKVHACCWRREVDFHGKIIRHLGVSFIFLSGRNPDDSERIEWGRFDKSKQNIVRRPITKQQLFKLLRCELHPDNLRPRIFRRHHKESKVALIVQAPLGFEYEEIVTLKS